MIWVRLIPVDRGGSEIRAEMDRKHLPTAEPGMLFNFYSHRKGKKMRIVIRPRRLPAWTQEQLDKIERQVQEHAAWWMGLT